MGQVVACHHCDFFADWINAVHDRLDIVDGLDDLLLEAQDSLQAMYTVFLPLLPQAGPLLRERFDVVLDALFGFSFQGQPRAPFDEILQVTPLQPSFNPAVTLLGFSGGIIHFFP